MPTEVELMASLGLGFGTGVTVYAMVFAAVVVIRLIKRGF